MAYKVIQVTWYQLFILTVLHVLDLAESDLVYTETLIQRGKIDYSNKDILILGAGDGALLWELLKENPNMVTMVEVIRFSSNRKFQYVNWYFKYR